MFLDRAAICGISLDVSWIRCEVQYSVELVFCKLDINNNE